MTDSLFPYVHRFRRLFSGLDIAFGTGKGEWIKRPVTADDYWAHLRGEGPGIGIGPLRPDNTVTFAAIDLDEPNFDAAREMQQYIPGTSWVERSRSGNAHVWVFFEEPIEAWIPMALLKMAIEAIGKSDVEVFPKNHDFAMVKLGNYINLPYHGNSRFILSNGMMRYNELPLKAFLPAAEASLNDPEEWRKKARWLNIVAPKPRNEGNFGEATSLHVCASHIIEEGTPIHAGHRNAVFFMLAKCLSNWRDVNHDEALMMLMSVNDESPDPSSASEIRRILANAERGQYTSTGCDDPLVLPYAHPQCPIAYPRR